ncbi:MAG: winged helix-turn-helix domain-containing protein [Acidobacteriaceae bacterium]|nr:winged helix-turn-helix domain-containing protein [Acidobacteriaceae bacterium]MBV8569855.1 winged helix-turn-helix domain-containing protein [Acidobacteriaceae bacterium]
MAVGGAVRFGEFELDIGSGELRRRGRRIGLGPQPLKILTALVAAPGEIVSREALCQRIWGEGTFVDFEHGLNFCIREIRSKLGDHAKRPRFIETIPRRGYRFIAGICAVSSNGSASPKEIQLHEIYVQARASLNQSGKESLEEARRLFEQVITLDPNYAMAHAGLGAAYALRNINRRDPEDLKSAHFHLRKALELDAELAEPYPWLCYVYVRLGQLEDAIKAGHQGVKLLPDLVQAQYFLGMTYLSSTEWGADNYQVAAGHLLRATLIAPRWQASWFGLSYIALLTGDYVRAREFGGHLLPTPGITVEVPFLGGEHALASVEMRQGEWKQARRILLGFLERMKTSDHMYRDTMSAAAACILGEVYIREGAIEHALASYHRAWHILQEHRRIMGHARLCVRAQAGLALAYASQGDRERATGLLSKGIEMADASTSISHCVPVVSLAEQFYAIAVAHIGLGALKDAMCALRRAAVSGWRDAQWLRRDPLLEPVRRSPEFDGIVDSAARFPPVRFVAD